MKVVPPGQARKRLCGQKQKNKKETNLRKIGKKRAIMSKKNWMARKIKVGDRAMSIEPKPIPGLLGGAPQKPSKDNYNRVEGRKEGLEPQIKAENPELPKLLQPTKGHSSWLKQFTGLVGGAPSKPSKETYNMGECRKEVIAPQIKEKNPKLPKLPQPRKSHGNWPKPITRLVGGTPPKPKPKGSGLLGCSPIEETLSRGHKLLLDMDTNFICSPRMIVRGDYENESYKLSVKRNTEGQFIEYNLIAKAKKFTFTVKARMLYRYQLTPDNKVYGYEHEEGWTWPGYGYCHSSSALTKYAELKESLYYKGFKISHFVGPNCPMETKPEGSWVECKEPPCGIRIWSVEINTYLTDLKENKALRTENKENTVILSLVFTNDGENFIYLETEGVKEKLNKVYSRIVKSPDVNIKNLTDVRDVYITNFSKDTEDQGQTASKIYTPPDLPINSFALINMDRTFGALHAAINLLYLNPACNFAHLVKLAKCGLSKEKDYVVHYLDQILNSQTVKNLNKPTEGSVHLTSAHKCIFEILKTLDKSLSKLTNTTMNTFISRTFSVCLDNIYEKCSVCKNVPTAFKTTSLIPWIPYSHEGIPTIDLLIANWLKWLEDPELQHKPRPLFCSCTPQGTKVKGSLKINRIPDQLFFGLKNPCPMKDVHKKFTILKQTYIIKGIVHQTPLKETLLSVRTSTGWVKVQEDGTILKYLPQQISVTGKNLTENVRLLHLVKETQETSEAHMNQEESGSQRAHQKGTGQSFITIDMSKESTFSTPLSPFVPKIFSTPLQKENSGGGAFDSMVDSTPCFEVCVNTRSLQNPQHRCRLCKMPLSVICPCNIEDPASDNPGHRIHKSKDFCKEKEDTCIEELQNIQSFQQQMSRTGDEFSQELKETSQPCKKKKTNNSQNEEKSCEYCRSTEQLPEHLEKNSDCLQLYIDRHNITERNHMFIIWLVCSLKNICVCCGLETGRKFQSHIKSSPCFEVNKTKYGLPSVKAMVKHIAREKRRMKESNQGGEIGGQESIQSKDGPSKCNYCKTYEELRPHLENSPVCLQRYVTLHNISENDHIWLVCCL